MTLTYGQPYQHRKPYTWRGKKFNIVSDSFHFHGLKGVIYIMHTILPLLRITIVQGFHSGKRIVIIVAREAACAWSTLRWLSEDGISSLDCGRTMVQRAPGRAPGSRGRAALAVLRRSRSHALRSE